MVQNLYTKYQKLQGFLKSLGSVAVAFSGGVDSTFLLHAAQEALGDQVIAVTASSCSFPKRELNEAKSFCQEHQIRHFIVASEELDIDGFRQNPKNRCYLCERELFEKILVLAKENHIAAVAEGSNLDDNGDYRPGLVAVKELGIASPLRYFQLSHSGYAPAPSAPAPGRTGAPEGRDFYLPAAAPSQYAPHCRPAEPAPPPVRMMGAVAVKFF